MTIAAAILLAATLTRSELIERMRAAPVTKVEGLVQVIADCPSDMRREFQVPVADFIAGVCNSLYSGKRIPRRRFAEPGIVVYIGEERTNRTDVVVRARRRPNGSRFTRMYIPAPGFADVNTLRRESAKAFYLAVKGEEIDDRAADKAVRDADPELRATYRQEQLGRWHRGEPADGSDEDFIKLSRIIIRPGVAEPEDVLRFASRLMLYPSSYAYPFCGKFTSCSFADAIDRAAEDPRLRFAAYAKAPEVALFGGGRGAELAAAADAYVLFLRDLAAYTKSKDELKDMLDDADGKLNIALEAARKRKEGSPK